MKVNIKILKYACISALILLTTAKAQVTQQAQTGFRFLLNPVSAEVIARGGTGLTSTYNSNAVFWNPAMLGFVQTDYDVNLNRTNGIADINYNAAAASIKLGEVGTLALSAMAMDYGTLHATVRADNDNGYLDMGTFSPGASAFGIAFSQKMNDRFSYGIQIKLAHQNLGEAYTMRTGDSLNLYKVAYKKNVIAGDVGAFYDFNYNGIRFGAVMQNISPQVKYEVEGFQLPFAISFGLSFEPLDFLMQKNPEHNFVLSVESYHPKDFGSKVKVGGEYSFSNLFFVRGGYMSNYDGRSFTAGAGIRQEISGINFRVDYAYQPYEIFGGVHFITLGIAY
ncbi:MAG: PorV/PorQ family protein [Ignavibacteria bacterium]|jgi:hypothetical protein|nr:PorV/PorQ family protein [Ignavibacteria bacterium]MCU7502060.1 PorV/PorQ family protein [Ignavibacteria bacterium]MCU7515462.1 PorV/PorQ family protein [Ignavibacteria bacterium]